MLNEMTIAQAAEYVGMKETAFRRICKRGEGPKSRREGRALRFVEEYLDEWVEAYRKKAYTYASTKPTAVHARGRTLKELE